MRHLLITLWNEKKMYYQNDFAIKSNYMQNLQTLHYNCVTHKFSINMENFRNIKEEKRGYGSIFLSHKKLICILML